MQFTERRKIGFFLHTVWESTLVLALIMNSSVSTCLCRKPFLCSVLTDREMYFELRRSNVRKVKQRSHHFLLYCGRYCD